MSNKSDFINNPSKKFLIIFTILYVISLILLLLAVTDIFRTELFTGSNTSLILLLGLSTFSLIRLYINYFKNRREERERQTDGRS